MMEQDPQNESKEELLVPEIQPTSEDDILQPPTKDVPTGKGHKLNKGLVKSANTPEDVQEALGSLTHENAIESSEDSGEIPTSEIIGLLRELKEQGVDFEDEDIDHISVMDAEERVDYIYQALLEAGIEDPEETLRQKGILE